MNDKAISIDMHRHMRFQNKITVLLFLLIYLYFIYRHNRHSELCVELSTKGERVTELVRFELALDNYLVQGNI